MHAHCSGPRPPLGCRGPSTPRNKNLGDGIDYGQQHRDGAGALGDLIHETLQLLERRGGPDAYINLKYIINVYESCMTA